MQYTTPVSQCLGLARLTSTSGIGSAFDLLSHYCPFENRLGISKQFRTALLDLLNTIGHASRQLIPSYKTELLDQSGLSS